MASPAAFNDLPLEIVRVIIRLRLSFMVTIVVPKAATFLDENVLRPPTRSIDPRTSHLALLLVSRLFHKECTSILFETVNFACNDVPSARLRSLRASLMHNVASPPKLLVQYPYDKIQNAVFRQDHLAEYIRNYTRGEYETRYSSLKHISTLCVLPVPFFTEPSAPFRDDSRLSAINADQQRAIELGYSTDVHLTFVSNDGFEYPYTKAIVKVTVYSDGSMLLAEAYNCNDRHMACVRLLLLEAFGHTIMAAGLNDRNNGVLTYRKPGLFWPDEMTESELRKVSRSRHTI